MSDNNDRLDRIERNLSDLARMAIQANLTVDRLALQVDRLAVITGGSIDRIAAQVDRLAANVDSLRLIVADHIENHHRGES